MADHPERFHGGNDLHFLTFSCYQRRPLFDVAARYDLFLKILERVRRRYRLVVVGYVVMPEHISLAGERTATGNIVDSDTGIETRVREQIAW
jgi:REP element-mobilizing transposase RayT